MASKEYDTHMTTSPSSSPIIDATNTQHSPVPESSLNPAPVSTGTANAEGIQRRRPVKRATIDENTAGGDGSDILRRGTSESMGTQRSGSGPGRLSRRQSAYDPNMGVIRRMTTGLFTPEKKIGKAPTYGASVKAAIMSSWVNVLLVFIPIGWALYLVKHAGGNESITDTAVFVTTFIAIIPLAALLGFATEEAALRLGQTMGGLLNATLGNAVELIVAILALVKCELAVVQSSLVGSILSNILLVLGMCFFAGGVRYAEQTVKSTAAQLNASLLLIAVIAVLIPSAFHFSIKTSPDGADLTLTSQEEGNDLLAMSHGVAILLLLLYVGYLIFQMWTHAHFYVDEEVTGSTRYPEGVTRVKDQMYPALKEKMHFHRKKKGVVDEEAGTISTGSSDNQINSADEVERREREEAEEEEEEVPQMNVITTLGLLVLITVVVGFTAEFLVTSIDGLVEAHPSLSQEWVGLILLPIVGNAAEHFTAVSVSVKDKLDLSISVAVGSSIQIALFVIPIIQLLAWIIGKPMTLLFDPYESIVLFLSVLIVNQTLSDGRSNWMEGLVLMFLYLIIAVSFWYYPGSNTATLVGCGS